MPAFWLSICCQSGTDVPKRCQFNDRPCEKQKKTIEETKPFSSDCPDLELFVTDRKTLCQSYGPVTTAIESA